MTTNTNRFIIKFLIIYIVPWFTMFQKVPVKIAVPSNAGDKGFTVLSF